MCASRRKTPWRWWAIGACDVHSLVCKCSMHRACNTPPRATRMPPLFLDFALLWMLFSIFIHSLFFFPFLSFILSFFPFFAFFLFLSFLLFYFIYFIYLFIFYDFLLCSILLLCSSLAVPLWITQACHDRPPWLTPNHRFGIVSSCFLSWFTGSELEERLKVKKVELKTAQDNRSKFAPKLRAVRDEIAHLKVC
jgi:hypothetical protein